MNKDNEILQNLKVSLCCFLNYVLSADIDKALSIFNELRKQDPYRIENMDTFSNLLYVRVSCFLYLDLIKLFCASIWVGLSPSCINYKKNNLRGSFFMLRLSFLFFQSMKSELSYLAHNLCEIDKYRVETCCVIGKNYYSFSFKIYLYCK